MNQATHKWKTWHKVFLAIIGIFVVGVTLLISNAESAGEMKDGTQVQNDSARHMAAIASGFSEWDGSHNNLVQFVKQNMNDPQSFEHVSTGYSDIGGDTLLIKMNYRGKNAFGAKMLTQITALVKIDGQIIKIQP